MFRFGEFAFDPESGEISSEGRNVRLTPQTAHVLTVLLEHDGRVVSKDELRKRVWPDATVEFDQSLAFCIRQLRMALDDDAASPTYIETLPRRGYRFVAQIQRDVPANTRANLLPNARHFRWKALSLVALLVIAAAVAWGWRAVAAERRVLLAIVPFDVDSTAPDLVDYRDRLAEAAVTRATQRGGARIGVLGPSTTGRFHSRTLIDSIRQATAADYALSGSVRRWDGGVRVFTQLIRSRDRVHVWVDRWFDSSATADGAAVAGARIADSAAWIVRHPKESRKLPK